ncbi:MAG TPA: hypothetical protein VKA88_00975 [Solirubrobacterales bacterium]|nr:hypothetical protein [Solirubrobacterales bacterium]
MLGGRLSLGQVIAAVGAIIVLVASFLDWVGSGGVSGGTVTGPGGASVTVPGVSGPSFNVWEIPGSVLDVFIVVAGVVALLPALLAFADAAEEFSFVSAATFVLGVVGILLVVAFLTVDFPGEGAERELGAYIGLAGFLVMAFGGFRAMQEEVVAGEI